MAPKTILFFVLAATSALLVAGQAAPDYNQVPAACANDCSSTVEVSYLCSQEYTSTTDVFGCFCNALPTDIDACSTCLNSNDAAALATLLSSAPTACPTAISQCFFECSFDTCASTDVACQCDASYLGNIFNCASCNTANGNTGATGLTDFQTLSESCANQNFTGADGDFTTMPLPSPTGQDAYVAPTLTGTGGGAAASGATSISASAPASSAALASSVSTSRSVSTSVSRSTSRSASGSTSASATVSSAAASSSGAAMHGVAAPAIGGAFTLFAALLALI